MLSLGTNHFGFLDYLAVALTLLISLAIGVYHAVKGRGKQSSEDLLMGGRKMSAIPIACSMLVTYFSAIAIIGYPAEIYSNGIQIFWIHILIVFICIPLAAYLFMSVLYKLKLTSVYEYFELRFDSPAVRCLASGIFILQMNIITGVALYAPAIALEVFLGLPIWLSVVGIGICGTIYTSIGGLKAVVWTDVFQFLLIIVGMVTIVTRGFLTAGGIQEAFNRAYDHGRLELFNWNVDPFQKYNTLNFVLGYGMAIVCFYGAHQPNVQRYSSLPTFREAIKAMTWNAVFKELTSVLIICTGVSIFATYAGCDPILLGEISKADQIVPYFFINELAWIPGMMGIFTSCIISAVLSTLSSALNSLAAVTWVDFLSRIPYFDNMGTVGKGNITCVLCAMYGAITIMLAFGAANLGSIFQLTITVIGAFAGALGGCFIMGLFLPYINKVGAIIGIVSGLSSTAFLTYKAFMLHIPYATLPTSIEGCPASTNFSMVAEANMTTMLNAAPEFEWPTKIYTISYVLYPFIGSMTTIIIGSIASIISMPFLPKPKPSCYDYLHPLVKRLCGIPESDSTGAYKKNQYSINGTPSVMNLKLTNVQRNVYGNSGDARYGPRGIENASFEMKDI